MDGFDITDLNEISSTHRGLTTQRIQSLTDCIFAFAMTLLVVNFPIPDLSSPTLVLTLYTLFPAVVSYILSFVLLGLLWVSHHNQYHFIRRADRAFLWINIFFLMFIVLVPFSTRVITIYHAEQIAVFMYGLNAVICGLLLYAHWAYATQNNLVDPDMNPKTVALFKKRILFAVLLVCVALAVSFFSIESSVAIFFLAVFMAAIPGSIDALMSRFEV